MKMNETKFNQLGLVVPTPIKLNARLNSPMWAAWTELLMHSIGINF
jgi:hypothetical protein